MYRYNYTNQEKMKFENHPILSINELQHILTEKRFKEIFPEIAYIKRLDQLDYYYYHGVYQTLKSDKNKFTEHKELIEKVLYRSHRTEIMDKVLTAQKTTLDNRTKKSNIFRCNPKQIESDYNSTKTPKNLVSMDTFWVNFKKLKEEIGSMKNLENLQKKTNSLFSLFTTKSFKTQFTDDKIISTCIIYNDQALMNLKYNQKLGIENNSFTNFTYYMPYISIDGLVKFTTLNYSKFEKIKQE